MYEKAQAQPAKCAQIKLLFFSKLYFLCSVRFYRQRDGERASITQYTEKIWLKEKEKMKREKSRHTVSDNLVVSTLLF
jgi:hypothetical protein